MNHLQSIALASCLAATAVLGQDVAARSATFYTGTELRYWDSTKACNGYTLFGARGRTYLLDMQGKVAHIWTTSGTNPRLLPYNGNLLDATNQGKTLLEVDWNGKTVWTHTESRSNYLPHHDFTRIYNKKLGEYTTLYIANKSVDAAAALAAGADPANGPYDGAQMDVVVEVDRNGKIVWEWGFFDHLVQDFDSTKANWVGSGKTISDYPNRLNANLPGRPIRRDWLHCNSLDYNAALGQIAINSVQGEFYVIDHDNTFVVGDSAASVALAASGAGDFLYRFGDPARYGQGDPPSISEDWTKSTTGNKQIGGAHDIQWIDDSLTGAGHFLVFNNGQYLYEMTPQSYIFEIDPTRDSSGTSTGSYVDPPDAGYWIWSPDDANQMKQKKNMSNQIVWKYGAKSNMNFFSHIGSSAQRLPNGNTLICAMTEGDIFEVTADGTVVWEYVVPVTPDGVKTVIDDEYPMYNSAFRAYRYGADHPALSGQDLTATRTIVEMSQTGIQSAGSRSLASMEIRSDASNRVVRFGIDPTREPATIAVTNARGQIQMRRSGVSANLVWDSSNLLPGIYFARMSQGRSDIQSRFLVK